MPSLKSQVFLSALGNNRSFFSRIGDRIMNIDPSAQRVANLPVRGTIGEYVNIADLPSMLVTPQQVKSKRHILLHCHGGAYVSGNLLQSRVMASHIGAATSLQVLTFAYQLAPQFPYPAQLEDALKAYTYLLNQGYDPKCIGIVGESAGGNLAIVLTHSLQKQKLPLPGCLVLLSPWTDLEQKGYSYATLQDADVTLNIEDIAQAALDYVGHRKSLLSDPMISPIYANFQGFPPTQIQVGTRELLLSDSELLTQVMERDKVDVMLLRWEGMPHVFQLYGFSESRSSMRSIKTFLKTHLDY